MNLLGPELRTEVTIHIREDWDYATYTTKMTLTPDEAERTVRTLLQAVGDIAKALNVQIEVRGQG